jgi:hypothetical protein
LTADFGRLHEEDKKFPASTPVSREGYSGRRRATPAKRTGAQCSKQRRRCDAGERPERAPILAAAIETFLDESELTKKPKTLAAYRTALNYFTESCRKLYLEDLERGDLLKFSAFLRDEKELYPRTVYNKFENVISFLKSQGFRGLVGKNDWPLCGGGTGGVRARGLGDAFRGL